MVSQLLMFLFSDDENARQVTFFEDLLLISRIREALLPAHILMGS